LDGIFSLSILSPLNWTLLNEKFVGIWEIMSFREGAENAYRMKMVDVNKKGVEKLCITGWEAICITVGQA
jgi:hypothetical protein